MINHKYKIGDKISWIQTSVYKKTEQHVKKILDQQKIPYLENEHNYIWERILTGEIIEIYDNRVTVTYIGQNGNIQKNNAHKRTLLIENILDK